MIEPARQLITAGNKTFLHNTVKQLLGYGWSINHAINAHQAMELLDKAPCRVGLLTIDPSTSILPLEIDSHSRLSDISWVAIIERNGLSQEKTRERIFNTCYAYQVPPIDVRKLDTLMENALAMANLKGAHRIPTLSCLDDEYHIVGDSPTMQRLYRTIAKVACASAPVLITGESGTGKELTAHAIHNHSPRRHGPFNVVNCGALPPGLIQSELFGHEKGAFTGANQRKVGIIEHSQGGTLFLDEIGDLPLDLQVNLLRFLEDLKVLRVGGLKEIPVDVRVLAATHVNLDEAVSRGDFREDLYHRLNVLQVRVPALREHLEDIEALAHFFFQKFSTEKPTRVCGFSHACITVMRQHRWPGNIRELVNRVRRSMVMCEQRLITPADMGLERRHGLSRGIDTLQQVRDAAELEAIRSALARNKHNVLRASLELGVSRVTLYRLIEKHGIAKNGCPHERQTIHVSPR
ncbi:sigma-54 dependent transcriptional regulator [Halomonas janggokensis]|uniref:Sigma-54 dependent transcriptional regulator n=1 Tax=Vreelandella janggokensis TaxID=370767 RepID=A0ABT4IVX6_9GAMM|nr:sigma-54 dependent transcriptional regulator [Halomonas janggokensis]MCZ0927605.1 sigma-54 dependent transcriptional regulator [Halomonas janggokensis]MCZ0930113.1 sigma-54 dependent transcriptional regulator [Halomonas janggokensis]